MTTIAALTRRPADERRAHARAVADAIRTQYGLPPADPSGRPSVSAQRCDADPRGARRIAARRARLETLGRRFRRVKSHA